MFMVFIAYPIFWVVASSIVEHEAGGGPRSVGLSNYARALTDPVFWIVVRNMVYWGAITIPVQMLIGGVIAYHVERYTQRSKTFFRTMFFLPVVTSVSVVAIVWAQMYAPYYGVVQYYLRYIGIHLGFSLLGDANTTIFALIIVNIWQWTGFSMIMYVAGLNNIPNEIYDAARIDGASGWMLASRILVPLLAPVTKSLLLLGIIGTLQTFPIVYLMTDGGPDHASEIFGSYIFKQGFVLGNTGYSATLSVLVLLISLVLSIVQIVAFGTELSPAQRARR
jgi:ABC-type sugar transport system permease subunit